MLLQHQDAVADGKRYWSVVNTVTNRVAKLLGKDETSRWLNLALYQGAPLKKGLTTLVCLSAGDERSQLAHDNAFAGNGVFGEPPITGQRHERPDPLLYGFPQTAILHLFKIATRVRRRVGYDSG